MGTPPDRALHDVHAIALPGEPIAVLHGRDPLASLLLFMLSDILAGKHTDEARHWFDEAARVGRRLYQSDPDLDGAAALARLGSAMAAWRHEHDGASRRPHSPAAGGPTWSRGDLGAVHMKLDLLLQGQQTIMTQQAELDAGLASVSDGVTAMLAHVTDLEDKLRAKGDDLGVDLSSEIETVTRIRTALAAFQPAAGADTATAGTGADTPAAGDGTTAS